MSYQGKLKRYLLVLERLRHPPSFAELKAHLEDHGFETSVRTLQRDLEELRAEFGVRVVHDALANTYSVEDGHAERDAVVRLLERAQLMELVRDGSDGLAEHVRFEELGRLQGIHHLAPLLRAIRERREVEVAYRKFHAEGEKRHRVRPALLKEYHGRWYLLGRTTKHAGPIALGLDRIVALEVLRTRFKRDNGAVAGFYDHVIGVDASPGKPERVLLRLDPVQAEYVKALPLHDSQRVEQEDADGVTISLFVMPNTELRQAILSWGASVRVLEPKSLAKEIRKAHKEAAARYKG